MSISFAGFLLLGSISYLHGSTQPGKPVVLCISLTPSSTTAPPQIAIEVRNISDKPQRGIFLTNSFVGMVYLRDSTGQEHRFVHTNTFIAILSGTFSNVGLERDLQPGEIIRFHYALTELIDLDRRSDDTSFYHPDLANGFKSGCELWCTLHIRYGIYLILEEGRRRANLKNSKKHEADSGLLISNKLRHPEEVQRPRENR